MKEDLDSDDDPLRSVMAAGLIMALFVWAITSIFVAGVMEWLWNALLTHWPSINYTQAWMFYVAVSIIVVVIKGICAPGEEQ